MFFLFLVFNKGTSRKRSLSSPVKESDTKRPRSRSLSGSYNIVIIEQLACSHAVVPCMLVVPVDLYFGLAGAIPGFY